MSTALSCQLLQWLPEDPLLVLPCPTEEPPMEREAPVPRVSHWGSTDTASEGTSFVPLCADAPAEQVVITNNTGTTLEVRSGAARFFLPSSTLHVLRGLTNARELELRRADTSDAPVTLTWETALF